MPAREHGHQALGELAAEIFGAERVTVAPRLDDAIEAAVGMAEGEGVGTPGVLVSGSVVLVGEARGLLVDNIAIDGTPIGTAETDTEGWVFKGFKRTSGTEVEKFFNAYIAENRQYDG